MIFLTVLAYKKRDFTLKTTIELDDHSKPFA